MKSFRLHLIIIIGLIASCKEVANERKIVVENSALIGLIQAGQDSVEIEIHTNLSTEGIHFINHFNEREFLSNKKEILPFPITLFNGNYKTSSYFPVDQKIENLSFLQNESDKFWYLQTLDSSYFYELNFDVFFRKNAFPINDVNDFLKYRVFNTPAYINNHSLREKAIDYYYEKKENFLFQYRKEKNLPDSFYNKWMNLIKYEKLHSETSFGLSISKYDKKYLDNLLSKSLPLIQDEHFLEMVSFKRSCLSILELLKFIKYGSIRISFSENEDLISNNFKNGVKDFLLFVLLTESFSNEMNKNEPNGSFELSLQNYLNTSKSKEKVNYLTQRLNSNIEISKEFQVLDVENISKSFSELQSEQFAYLDFWASWCAPCIAEMPNSKTLKNEYAQKGINFIYLSIDENSVSWSRAMKRIGLTSAESYLIPKGNESDIAKKFNISSIPRYIILNKEGKVIDENAPRPSDPEIKSLFDNLLDEN